VWGSLTKRVVNAELKDQAGKHETLPTSQAEDLEVESESHAMVLLVEVGNKGTGIVVCCQRMRRGRLLVWLTVLA